MLGQSPAAVAVASGHPLVPNNPPLAGSQVLVTRGSKSKASPPKSGSSGSVVFGSSNAIFNKSSYGKGSLFRGNRDEESLQAMRDRAHYSELRVTRKIFHNFDADGSGTIDTVELRAVMHAMGHDLTDQQLSELVEQVDADGSGDICFDEFVQLIGIWKEVNQFKIFQSDSRSLQEQRIEEASRVNLLLPDSYPIVVWQFLVLLAIVYSYATTGYLIATTSNEANYDQLQNYTLATDIIASIIFSIDVLVTFCTAVRVSYNGPDRTLVIDDAKQVALGYALSPWLTVDVLAIPPVLRFLPRDSSYYAAIFIILKALKIPKLFRRSGKQKMTPVYVYTHFYVIPAIRTAVYFAIWTHSMAVIWTLISIYTSDPTQLVNGGTNSTMTGGNSTSTLASTSNKQLQVDLSYTNSIYFVLVTITTCGYGDVIVIGNTWRIIFACLLCVCGTLLTGIVIGSIVSILSKTDIDQERESKLRETLAVCQHFEVPESLAAEVLNFQNHLLADSFSDAYADLVMGLPAEMKMNISLFTRVDLVSNMDYFKTAHQGAKVAVAALLQPVVFRPEENIVVAGEKGDCMYFIGYGFVDIMSKSGRSIVVLKRGGFFGEGALLAAGQTRNATVKAITYCDLFMLTRPNFEKVLQRFPRFKSAMIQTSRERAKKLAEETGTANPEIAASFHARMAVKEARENLMAEKSALFHDTMYKVNDLLSSMETLVSELSRNKSGRNQSSKGVPWTGHKYSGSGHTANLGDSATGALQSPTATASPAASV